LHWYRTGLGTENDRYRTGHADVPTCTEVVTWYRTRTFGTEIVCTEMDR